LVEYCQLLFKASNGELSEKALGKHLVKIENIVKNKLGSSRIEIAFISYKASMSDSLESIYLAAKDDPDCDAYWIPVPYTEHGSGGAADRTVYEGAEHYPDYIECTDWRQYDFEARRPDAVFTFNPYDGANYVTSIHPNFYCERLREFTDMLVYCPYFVVPGDKVPEHFVALPGCIYAHRVIVQSEKVRKSYISEFEKSYGNHFGKPEDKFVALGSPKYDKVLSARREDYELPEKWRELVKDKKVILYNTSIGAVLKGGELYLDKLKHVLETFRKREDVLLWWRPHPLLESTFRSMRPQLLEEYNQTVSQYIHDGWGIYDDLPDFHRAIAWSDAYYGDRSSVMVLYQATEKPIVIQDVKSMANEVLLRFADFAFDDDGNAWAFSLFGDGLFKLDFETNTAELMAKGEFTAPKYEGKPSQMQTHSYIAIHCAGNEVICFPYYSDSIFVYNRRAGKTKHIQLNHEYMTANDYNGFALRHAVEYQGKVYAFGLYSGYSKAVIIYDAMSGNVSYDTSLYEKDFAPNQNREATYPIYISDCSEDGAVAILFKNCEHLIRYNLATQKTEYIASNAFLSECFCAAFDGEHYWFVSETNDKLIKWTAGFDDYFEYSASDDGFTVLSENAFGGISDFGEHLLLYPLFGDIALSFDKNTERFSEYIAIPAFASIGENIYKYDLPKQYSDKIYALSRVNATIYELHGFAESVTPHGFKLSREYFDSYFDGCFYNYLHLRDSGLGNIAEFFEYSLNAKADCCKKRQEYFPESSINKDGTSGHMVYEFVKSKSMHER